MFETIIILALFLALIGSAWMETVAIALVAGIIYVALGYLVIGLPEVTLFTLVASSSISLGIGALWSLWKWRRWVKSPPVQKALRTAKTKYDKSSRSEPFRESDYFPDQARPSKHVDRIISWITLWMFSMIVYFFEDFLMDIGRWIYNRLGRIYENITTSALPDDMK